MEVTHQQLDDLRNDLENKIEKEVDKLMNQISSSYAKLEEGLKAHADHDASRFRDVNKELDNRVTFKVFSWILGILLVIVMGLFGVIWYELQETQDLSRSISDVTIELKTQWDLWTNE